MSHPIDKAYIGLKTRAEALEALVDETTDKQTRASVQSAYAALMGAAELVIELEDQSYSQIDSKIVSAKNSKSAGRALDALLSVKIVLDKLPGLLESGVLLSQGKDLEAIKHIGKEVLRLAVDAGVKLSGVKLLKDIAEVVSVLEDLAKTGQSFRFRKKQVQEATKLRKWILAIVVANIAWSFTVQRFLCDISGRASATDDEVLNLVLSRMAKSSQSWKPKSTTES